MNNMVYYTCSYSWRLIFGVAFICRHEKRKRSREHWIGFAQRGILCSSWSPQSPIEHLEIQGHHSRSTASTLAARVLERLPAGRSAPKVGSDGIPTWLGR